MSVLSGSVVDMAEPRRTTVGELQSADIGRVVRFTPPWWDMTTQGVLVSVAVIQTLRGMMPVPGRRLVLQPQRHPTHWGRPNLHEFDLSMRHPLEVLDKPGRVERGSRGSDAVQDRLDSDALAALRVLRQQTKNEN